MCGSRFFRDAAEEVIPHPTANCYACARCRVSGRFVPQADLGGFKPSAVQSGAVQALESIAGDLGAEAIAYHHQQSSAYPRGFSVTIENGKITGGLGSF